MQRRTNRSRTARTPQQTVTPQPDQTPEAAGQSAEHAGPITPLTAYPRSDAGRNRIARSMSRVQGNQHLQRMIATGVQRHTSVAIEEEENAVQRHTSVAIEEEENAVQRWFLQRDLASELTEAMDGIGTDEDAIFNAIDAANSDSKRAILNNQPILADLRDELDQSDMAKALRKLEAPLADQLDHAMTGSGTDEAAIFSAIEDGGTSADQKRLVLRNPQLMARLRDELDQEDCGRAMRGLGASLTEQIYAAIEGMGTEEQQILDAIAVAPADQKLAALRDRALMTRLADDLSQSEMLQTLEALGASLADRLNMAMDGIGTDEESIYSIVDNADATQKQEILSNAGLMTRLRDELTQTELMRVLQSLGASLADLLGTALAGGADSAIVVALLTAADDTQRAQVRENTALVGQLQAALPETDYAEVCGLLGLPVPGVTDGGDTGDAGTDTGDAGTDTGTDTGTGTSDGETAPGEPATLVGKVSTALDQTPPDGAAAIAAITAATPDERATVGTDTALRERLYAALDQTQLLQVLPLLGVNLPSRITLLLDRTVPIADIQAHIAAATVDEKRTVLDDRVLIERLLAYAGEAQRDALLTALGDTLGNRIDQLLAQTPTLEALWNAIRPANDASRQEVYGNSMLMGRIAAAFTPHEFFRTQLLLLYGNETAFPGPVVTLSGALSGTPTLATIRTPLGNIADADVLLIKVAVREYMRPLLSAEDFVTLGRMLDQGLIFEETINQDWNETLQIDDPATAGVVDFVPRNFTGNQGFDVGYYRDRVQVTLRIKFDAISGDTQAETDLPGLMTGWETMIENAWDNKFSLQNAQRTLPIRIDMVYNSGSPHHHVNVGSATNVSWPGYNTANWFYRATAYNHAHAPLHEFGHMLGSPDEYSLSAIDYQNTVGTAAATDPNATAESDAAGNQRFTNSSLMGSGGTVEKRHLNYFTNWLNSHRQAGEPAYALI